MRAQANLTRRLAADLERIGVSATGFTISCNAAPAASASLQFDYHVIG